MKVVSKRIWLLSFMLIFCSAFMSGGFFVSDAYAQKTTTAGSAAVSESNKVPSAGGGGASIDIKTNSGQCAGTGMNPFDKIACKASATLGDLRILIYIIGGFGLIAFTFAAIFGKISWKHLAQLTFSLFLVSMMAPFIEYFTGGGSEAGRLKFGSFLPSKVIHFNGSSNSFDKQSCGDNCREEVVADGLDPSTPGQITGQNGAGAGGAGAGAGGAGAGGAGGAGAGGAGAGGAGAGGAGAGGAGAGGAGAGGAGAGAGTQTAGNGGNSSWGGKDIKSSAQSALDAARAAIEIANSSKTSMNEIGRQTDRIKKGLGKIGSGGIRGIADAASEITGAGSVISDTVYRHGKTVERDGKVIEEGIDAVTGRKNQPSPSTGG